MTFLAKDPHGGEVAIPMDETLKRLKDALPTRHPVVAAVESCFDLGRGVIEDHMDVMEDERPDVGAALDRLVTQLEDWRSGIRGWEEVEPAFEHAKKAAEWV